MKDRRWLLTALGVSFLAHLALTLTLSFVERPGVPRSTPDSLTVTIVDGPDSIRTAPRAAPSVAERDAAAATQPRHAEVPPSNGTPDDRNPASEHHAAPASVSSGSGVAVDPSAPAATPPPTIAAPAAPVPQAAAVAGQPPDDWEQQVRAKLLELKRYPAPARYAGLEDTIFLTIRIARNGRVSACTIQRSGGIAVLNAAALDLVRRASPLPPPPPSVAGNEIDLTVPVTYSLRRVPQG